MEGNKMSLEDKTLLVQDLSARLPYAVKVEHKNGIRGTLHEIFVSHRYDENDCVKELICTTNFFGGDNIFIEYIKPCLFPMSSMTEEQKEEYLGLCNVFNIRTSLYFDSIDSIDWLNKNHFDYRGLIDKGLAIDATGLNIYCSPVLNNIYG